MARKSKSKIKVTDSCGCVFCDINLKPRKHDGKLMHYVRAENKWVPCLRKMVVFRYERPRRMRLTPKQIAAERKELIHDIKRAVATSAELATQVNDTLLAQEKVTRFEVIDPGGRAYVGCYVIIHLSYQDEGKTLKVFVRSRADQEAPKRKKNK